MSEYYSCVESRCNKLKRSEVVKTMRPRGNVTTCSEECESDEVVEGPGCPADACVLSAG